MTTRPRKRTAQRLMGLLVLLALALPSASALVGLGCPHHGTGAGHGAHAGSVGHGARSDHGGGHHGHEAPSADRAAPEDPLSAPSPPCDCVGECPVPTALGAPPASSLPALRRSGTGAATSWRRPRGSRLGLRSWRASLGGRWCAAGATTPAATQPTTTGDSHHDSHDDEPHHHSMMVPTVREDLRGGTRVDIPLGLNLYMRSGPLAGHRIAVEWHLPVYQNLNGPQLETDWLLTVGWQKAFEPIGHH